MDLKISQKLERIPANAIQSGAVRFDLFFKAYPRPIYIWQFQQSGLALVNYNNSGEVYLADVADLLIKPGSNGSNRDGKEILNEIRRCYQEKNRFKHEYPAAHLISTGEVKDLEITYAYIEPGFVMTIVKDVTAERSVINELKWLSNAVEQTADAVFITDRTGFIEYVNPAFEQITGYERVEVLGKTPRVLKSGEMTPGYYEKLWKTILAGKAFQGQTINHRRDGSKLIVEQTITPMKDQSGQITHFVSLLKDMTERIHFQEKETEHRLAGSIQKGLFPKQAPIIEGYDIAGTVFSASNTSGDCFDFIPMLDGTTGIVVGDVCGHGMGPALLMASARAYLRSITRYVSDPTAVLRDLHSLIYGDLIKIGFITMMLARLDPSRHRLEYANAGNWPAYVLDAQGNITHELRTGGVPIGLDQQFKLGNFEPVLLEPGSLVVFLTDGIPEAHNVNDQEYGLRRMLTVIRENRQESASEIIQRVRQDVLEFSGAAEQEDDQTIVICKRLQ